MGRKKRKVAIEPDEPQSEGIVPVEAPLVPPPSDPRFASVTVASAPPPQAPAIVDDGEKPDKDAAAASSKYAISSHSGEIVEEDIYVSDGSEDEDEVEVLLVGSRMGLMRRGLHQPLLVQPNRQWVRNEGGEDGGGNETSQEQQRQQEEEALAKLDPAERAARLLAEKQRKLEEAKDSARRLESEENAGRDPCLFSKRTAFDIRFDQIDDKPWTRGTGDLTDFFNYGLTVEDWLDYAQQQLMIRQELTDASRQKRLPDPNVVPVTPRTPKTQTPKVAVAVKAAGDSKSAVAAEQTESEPVIGPALVKKEESADNADGLDGSSSKQKADIHIGAGGAWGAGAAPGSVLARLIEEQEQKEAVSAQTAAGLPGVPPYCVPASNASVPVEQADGKEQETRHNTDMDEQQSQDWRRRDDYRNDDMGGRRQHYGSSNYGGRNYDNRYNNHYSGRGGRGRGRGYNSQQRRGRGDFRRNRDDYGDRWR